MYEEFQDSSNFSHSNYFDTLKNIMCKIIYKNEYFSDLAFLVPQT